MTRPVTRQGVPSLDPPRNGRTREHVALSGKCHHRFVEVRLAGEVWLECSRCPHSKRADVNATEARFR